MQTYLDDYYYVLEAMKSNWGRLGQKIKIFCKYTNKYLACYYYNHHRKSPLYWEKRFAADMLNKA